MLLWIIMECLFGRRGTFVTSGSDMSILMKIVCMACYLQGNDSHLHKYSLLVNLLRFFAAVISCDYEFHTFIMLHSKRERKNPHLMRCKGKVLGNKFLIGQAQKERKVREGEHPDEVYYIAMRLFETASLLMHDSCIYKGKSKIFLGILVWRQKGSPGLQPAARTGDDAVLTQLSSRTGQSQLGCATAAFAFPPCLAGSRSVAVWNGGTGKPNSETICFQTTWCFVLW